MAFDPSKMGPRLGQRLRAIRTKRGWSLRDVALKAGVNHGYLSQLERGEVSEPGPGMLHKIAKGYGEPLIVLMRWAGYTEPNREGLTPNQARALSYLGEDVSDEELSAIEAVINALRPNRATFPQKSDSLDGSLLASDVSEIRERVMRLLNKADVVGTTPTPLDQVIQTSRLVLAGEISLEADERRALRKRFGSLVDNVLQRLQGLIHFRAQEVWIRPDLHELKRRFVTAHEVGHNVLPWQRDVIAYLDDAERLRPDVRSLFEREANQASIEILSQGDALRAEADDSILTEGLLWQLSDKYQISMQAVARRVIEETRKAACVAIRFRGRAGRPGPYHVYCSRTFGQSLGWHLTGLPSEARTAVKTALSHQGEIVDFDVVDLSGQFARLRVDAIDMRHALIMLFTPSNHRTGMRRLLRIG